MPELYDFIEAYQDETGLGMDEIGQMLTEYEDLVRPYLIVEDEKALAIVRAMAWYEVERKHHMKD